MTSVAVKVTLCPPSMNGERFDRHQFPRINSPVGAHYIGNGEWASTSNFSFDDYDRAQTRSTKLFASRRFATPDWATCNEKLQTVLLAYLAQRAFGTRKLNPWSMSRSAMTTLERLRWIESVFHDRVPRLEKTVDRLCEEYVELRRNGNDPPRLRKLESLIGNLDSCLIISRSPARIVASAIYCYYRLGMTSVGVAEATGLHPPACRQIIRRIWKTAITCGFDAPARVARCSSKHGALDEAREKTRQ
jgi:hypothetical protein